VNTQWRLSWMKSKILTQSSLRSLWRTKTICCQSKITSKMILFSIEKTWWWPKSSRLLKLWTPIWEQISIGTMPEMNILMLNLWVSIENNKSNPDYRKQRKFNRKRSWINTWRKSDRITLLRVLKMPSNLSKTISLMLQWTWNMKTSCEPIKDSFKVSKIKKIDHKKEW